MISTIYIENEVLRHHRSREICERFPRANVIPCKRYGEVFNRNYQDFRLQKQGPSLILAKKNDHFILEAPKGYGIGGGHNYYFSHLLNCPYDCRYCFFQGMFRSANYLLFVNFEDFENAIQRTLKAFNGESVYFFSGFDCDSLALDRVTGFIDYFLPVFRSLPNGILELRTKSVQIRSLLNQEPLSNCVVAFSFSPENIAQALEHQAPPVSQRIDAMACLQRQGWPVGLRFDPLIYHEGFQENYAQLLDSIFHRIDPKGLHSVSLGTFRVPERFYNKMWSLYPEEPLFSGPLKPHDGMVSYIPSIEQDLVSFSKDQLYLYIPKSMVFENQ